MYVGRIVSVGRTKDNKLTVMYRVSSRSFPNREIAQLENSLAVIPKKGHHEDIYTSPYISYNCFRSNSQYAVVGNGTQADPVFEKLESGMNMRDAIANVLLAMDYEHDDYSTPRIVAVADQKYQKGALGSIRADGIDVQVFDLSLGEYRFVSTYEKCVVSPENQAFNLDITDEKQAAQFVINGGVFAEFTNPVSSVAAVESDDGYKTAIVNM
ncbi:IMP cyclohydrolase [Leucothrix arctica]|uniref:IMP cyclohydrolase n=1 Tax=Leucothrix arctica TaxID=1481894 RepID=A0A317CG42_9GAMM|nr:IMP cyclohydrolase [Leucothrix arctica]PWQ97357.1 IMP cyclohydrolase [Leucothrix arctica]